MAYNPTGVDPALWPQLYDDAMTNRQAVLDAVYDYHITEQIIDDGSSTSATSTSGGTGQLTLDFTINLTNPKAALIKNEMCLLVNYPTLTGGQAQDVFVVRTITDSTDASNYTRTVAAEGRWYDLGTADAIRVTPAVTTPSAALSAILAGSGWSIGTISPALSGGPAATFEIDTPATPLAAIRGLPGIFGGEIAFDTVNKTVSLVTARGNQSVGYAYIHGANVSSDNRVVDTTNLATRVYPIGNNGVDITTVNGGVGYIENYSWYDAQVPPQPHVVHATQITNDSLTDPTMLLKWGQQQLSMLCLPRVTYNLSPIMLNTDGVPGIGDVVRVFDKGTGIDVNSRVVNRDLYPTDPLSTKVTINTSAFTISAALGSAPRGTVTPVTNLDHLPPAYPTGLTVSGLDTIDGNGNHVEYLNFSWNPVTKNSDNSPCVDLDHYEVQYRLGTNSWVSAGNLPASMTATQSGPLPPGAAFTWQVRAVDKAGNGSNWSSQSATTPGVPAPTINPPSAPTVDTTAFPLTGRITWDGHDSSGASYPNNLQHIEVHVSTVSGFTPSTATLYDQMRDAGLSPVTGLTPGTTYYTRFVAVDTAGFKSGPSIQTSFVPTQVQDGQIAAMSISKLLAASLTADMTVSARIKTADTGARVELNSAGVKCYDASSNLVVDINSSGTATFSGAVSGGTMDVPAQGPSVAGRFHVDSDDVQYSSDNTTNLCTNPAMDTSTTGVTPSGSTVAISNSGAVINDWYGNIDLQGPYGAAASLKVINTSSATAAGYVTINLGAAQPNTVYTVSFLAANSTVADTIPTGNIYGDQANMRVTRSDTGATVKAFFDGYCTFGSNSIPGRWTTPSGTSGYAWIGMGGWSVRWYTTFTTPSNLPANTNLNLIVPSPCTSTGAVDKTNAICYAAVQMEQKAYLTRYCDGNQMSCVWNGTAGASTSTRNGFSGLYLPSWGDPQLYSNLVTNYTESKRIKRGSGAPQGTNYIKVIQPNSWGGFTPNAWNTLAWSQTYTTRISQDDGSLWDGGSTFYAPVDGLYSWSLDLYISGMPAWSSTQTFLYQLIEIASGITVSGGQWERTQGRSDLHAHASGQQLCAAGQSFHLQVLHTITGSNLTINGNASGAPNVAHWTLVS